MNNKQPLVPLYRFVEFEGEWQVKKVGDVLKIGSGRDYKHLKKGDIPVYGTGGLMLHVSDYLYDGKSIGIGRKGTIDQPQFLTGKFWAVDTLFYTHSYKDSTPEFLYSIFQRINWQKWNEASGVPSLSKSTIEKIKVYVPTKKEQEKIAEFLTAVDERIMLMEKKLELLKKYKKGVMQKIFTQQIRFKDENGDFYPDWEEKKLSELVQFSRGALLSKSDIIADGRYECVHYGELFTEYNEVISEVKSRTNLDTGVDSRAGDILMPTSDVTPQGLARASVICKDGVKLGGDINILRPLENVDSVFLSYLLNAQKKRIMRIVSGTTIRHVYSKDLSKVRYTVPVKKHEQEAISSLFVLLDDRISLDNKRLRKAKEFKKSLLQRMFV